MMKWLELAFQSLLARWTRVDRILDSVHSTGTTSCRSSSSRLPPLLTPSVLFHRLQLRRWPRRQLPLQLRPTVAALEGHPSSCGPSSLAPSRSLCCFLPSSGSAASRVRDTGTEAVWDINVPATRVWPRRPCASASSATLRRHHSHREEKADARQATSFFADGRFLQQVHAQEHADVLAPIPEPRLVCEAHPHGQVRLGTQGQHHGT